MPAVALHGQVIWDKGSALQQVFTTVKGRIRNPEATSQQCWTSFQSAEE